MAELVAIVGPSGSGKTRSLMGLDPKESCIISLTGKKIPMKGFSSKYKPLADGGNSGNYYQTKEYSKVIGMLKKVSKDRPEIKNVVIDDYNYLGAFEYFKRANESGFNKFAEIGQHIANPLIEAAGLRDDLKIFVINHDETITEDFKPFRKMKTIGKLVDNTLTMEGLFTIVLFTEIKSDKDGFRKYGFVTNSDGSTTAKSPEGMFEDFIPNDLGYVVEKIDAYYE